MTGPEYLTGTLRCGVALSGIVLSLALGAAPAAAQVTEPVKDPASPEAQAPRPDDTLDASQPSNAEGGDEDEIIITGTLVRGIAPPGTNVIGLSQGDVRATGSTSTAQLLQTIPQLGSFNNLQFPAGGFGVQSTNRPNLRNLPGFTTAGSSTTLVLMDGHRLVGMGVQSTTPDPDVIPPGLIERVEIVPDGGSGIYGSDAVAGVINFITRKSFKGVEVDARYGFGIDYNTFDANATAGHDWGSGSAFVSYNYSRHDAIYGRDRDFLRMFPTNVAGIPFPVIGIRCSPGNVATVPGFRSFALPFTTGTAVPDTVNQCDETDAVTLYPKEYRHSAMAGVSQELSEGIRMDVRGFYMKRHMYQSLGRNLATSFIGPATIFGFPTGLTVDSPFRTQHLTNPFNPFEIHQVSYAFGGGDDHNVTLDTKTWGIAPTITADLGGGWQLRALASYGRSKTLSDTIQTNGPALDNAIRAGLFNPYDVAASNPAAVAAIQNFENFGLSHQRLFNARVVIDGDLLTLPGGAVKLAAGVEYLREHLASQKGTTVPGFEDTGFTGLSIGSALVVPAHGPIPVIKRNRNVKAAFGELVIPIFGEGNGGPGMKELTVSASGRYDDYSDVGGTFNPKFGVTYKPLDWVKLRGAWGKSFVAPSLADSEETDLTSFNWVSGLSLLFPPPALIANGTWPAPGPQQTFVAVVLGVAPGIQPQKATTWSLGIDLDPPVVPGLNLSLTYWNINFKGVIAIPPFLNQNEFWGAFAPVITVNPTQAQINSFLGVSDNIVGSACAPSPTCLYAILDIRERNLGNFKLGGLDFSANYNRQTHFGSVDFGINANYELNRKQSPIAGAAFADLLAANASRFRFRAAAGAQIGDLRWQLIWNHSHGYKLNPAVGIPPQRRVGSFNVFDLFVKYDVPGEGLFKDLSFTLNVNNILNEDPPEFRRNNIVLNGSGYANGNTVGRLIQLGVSKKF